ncbi:hypothetical protein PRIPAC_82277 [Pristionchus pacificus]|uniref:Uncharacterized protein n=1 Tax=Pristionchus pacificus TaxID=54126 RepID=A0A2A6CPQ4_PRIPA|nr:hypothetical protein PRIPAC_82277 [Pristionchus pacificus]|eukprot:PDM80119.1 hypothetical protein PRIPAC_32698 [Pristionchus pacificus]
MATVSKPVGIPQKPSSLQSAVLDLSPFEQLPRQLIDQIIGHVPEAVFEMRLTCRLLKSLVDEHGKRPCDIPIVQRIAFTVKNAWLSIPKRRTALFELRLTLHQPALKFMIQRYFNGLEHPSQYGIEITSLPDDVLDDLRCCLGTRIVETSLPHYHDGMVPSIFDLIKDIKLEKLEMFADLNSAKVGNGLLKQLRENRVDELFLTVQLLLTAAFLLDLSTIVRSLLITQLCFSDKDLNQRHFLGIDDFNWTPVILGMFERRLDKMLVRTDYCAYLTLQSADDIRRRLPLLGKGIWFETRCNAFDQYEDRLDYVTNDHSVKALRWTPFHNALAIKHCSRESEKLEF